MALGGENGLGKMLAHKGQGEAGPSSKIVGVDGIIPGGYHGAETGTVQINYKIFKRFHFVGAVDMRLRKRWIGRRSRRSENYVPEAVGAVALASNGGSVNFDEVDGVGG